MNAEQTISANKAQLRGEHPSWSNDQITTEAVRMYYSKEHPEVFKALEEMLDPKNMFNIYHPINGEMNYNCDKGKFEYELVATISATSLDKVYPLAQNFNTKYAELGIRSTSVGDIITDGKGGTFMIKNIGFEPIPHKELTLMTDIESSHRVGQMIMNNPEDFGLV